MAKTPGPTPRPVVFSENQFQKVRAFDVIDAKVIAPDAEIVDISDALLETVRVVLAFEIIGKLFGNLFAGDMLMFGSRVAHVFHLSFVCHSTWYI